MLVLRKTLVILGIILAPFVLWIGLFFGIHGFLYDGYGPDDGELMAAMMIATPVAGLIAICAWSVAIIYGITTWFGRDRKQSETNS
ncbi:MAG: hypothetical protein R3242_02615 [Akkermansiaceae bacterium]|nr:hypothetical protein [Akkermansiaceae bacterium]